jgi:hypothetical protein
MAKYSRLPSVTSLLLLPLIFFCPAWSHAETGGGSTEQQVRQTLEEGIAAFNKENLPETLKALDPDAPTYEVTKERISRIFKNHDVDFELIDFDFVGETGPYAIARVKEKSTEKSNTDFRDNVTEALYIFRKKGDRWKLWGEYRLNTVFTDK